MQIKHIIALMIMDLGPVLLKVGPKCRSSLNTLC